MIERLGRGGADREPGRTDDDGWRRNHDGVQRRRRRRAPAGARPRFCRWRPAAPPSTRRRPRPPPRASPVAAPQTTGGPQTSPERKRLVDAFGGEYSAPTAERYLNGVLARLAPSSQTPSEPYRVTILDSPVVNAFALPSGDIFVTRGLLALANDGARSRR